MSKRTSLENRLAEIERLEAEIIARRAHNAELRKQIASLDEDIAELKRRALNRLNRLTATMH